MLVSLLATGILTQPELAGLKVPSMAGVLETIVGPWGAALINLGLIDLGRWRLPVLDPALRRDPLHLRQDGTFPKWFAGENANGSPANSLWVTNVLIQLFRS